MTFDYRSLQKAEANEKKVGSWHGNPVYAVSAANLEECEYIPYYIVYDDQNIIIKRVKSNLWRSYGWVSEGGTVNEYTRPRDYKVVEPVKYCATGYEAAVTAAHAVRGKNADECDGTAAVVAHDEVVGDVKLGIDVDVTLMYAREMTISDLLDGFNYGLNVAAG